MEEKASTLVEKVPGGHNFKEKATAFTEKAVDGIGAEVKDMIQEGHEFIDAHIKKEAHTKPDATVVAPQPVVASIPVQEKIDEKESSIPA
jgi:hypothetical protein